MRTLAALMLLAGLTLAIAPRFLTADSTPTTQKSPACCGDKCKTMPNCCTTDANGKTTCSMGGDCCVKADKK